MSTTATTTKRTNGPGQCNCAVNVIAGSTRTSGLTAKPQSWSARLERASGPTGSEQKDDGSNSYRVLVGLCSGRDFIAAW